MRRDAQPELFASASLSHLRIDFRKSVKDGQDQESHGVQLDVIVLLDLASEV